MCSSLLALINCTFTRTRLPLRRTLPSRSVATPSALPISRALRTASPRYDMTDMREMTFRSPIFERLVRISSCMRSGSGRSANALRSDVVRPGENQRDRKPDQQKHDDQAERPVWQLPRRKNGRADLNDKSSGDDVSCGDSINFSPLHFFEEAAHTRGFR